MKQNLVSTPVTGADNKKKEEFIMIYPLHRQSKSNILKPSNSYYTEEYAQRMYDFYLSDEVARDEEGRVRKFYRLHARHEHTQEMAFAYDIKCPKCHGGLKQIGRQISFNELGLYTCPACNRK